MPHGHKNPRIKTVNEVTTITPGGLNTGQVLGQVGPVMTSGGIVLWSEIDIHSTVWPTGEPNLILYMLSGDLTATEALAWLDTETTDPGSIVESVESDLGRYIRRIGPVGGPADAGIAEPRHDEFTVKPKIRFTEIGAGWEWMVLNRSPISLTTGESLRLSARHMVEWDEVPA